MLVGIALGVGLWLGLKGREKGKVNTSSQPSAVPTSTISPTVSPKRILQHGILENTSIAAITLLDDVRHVYFQETTGLIRRAIYSVQAKEWYTSVDDQIPLGIASPKNGTPLAVVSRPPDSIDGDLAWRAGLPDQPRLNRETLETDAGFEIPLPKSSFPYQRLAGTYAENFTVSYLYHQLSDSVFAEDLWDDKSKVWISKTFTIDTSEELSTATSGTSV
ncbi:MAG: hypothetical protein Q9208_003323 [Pyrenodesmia sp. 3 TL-2023]